MALGPKLTVVSSIEMKYAGLSALVLSKAHRLANSGSPSLPAQILVQDCSPPDTVSMFATTIEFVQRYTFLRQTPLSYACHTDPFPHREGKNILSFCYCCATISLFVILFL